MNFALGSIYTLIRRSLITEQAWDTLCEAHCVTKVGPFAVVLSEGGKAYTLWANEEVYIMTSTGDTFESVKH